jgi:hypothetical protein
VDPATPYAWRRPDRPGLRHRGYLRDFPTRSGLDLLREMPVVLLAERSPVETGNVRSDQACRYSDSPRPAASAHLGTVQELIEGRLARSVNASR